MSSDFLSWSHPAFSADISGRGDGDYRRQGWPQRWCLGASWVLSRPRGVGLVVPFSDVIVSRVVSLGNLDIISTRPFLRHFSPSCSCVSLRMLVGISCAFHVKVHTDPEVDFLFSLKISTLSMTPLCLAVSRTRRSKEAFGRISHIFYAKVNSDPEVDFESTCDDPSTFGGGGRIFLPSLRAFFELRPIGRRVPGSQLIFRSPRWPSLIGHRGLPCTICRTLLT